MPSPILRERKVERWRQVVMYGRAVAAFTRVGFVEGGCGFENERTEGKQIRARTMKMCSKFS